MPTSLVPERGEKYDLFSHVTPEKGDDFFSESATDNMLSTEFGRPADRNSGFNRGRREGKATTE